MIVFHHLNNDYTGSTRVFGSVLDSLDQEIIVFTSGNNGFIQKTKKTIKLVILSKYNSTAANFVIGNIYVFLKVLLIRNLSVYYSSTILCFGGALASWLRRKKIVLHQHEVGLGSNLLFNILVLIWNRLNPEIIVVSEFVKSKNIINTSGITHVVPNSLPRQWSACLKEEKSFNGVILMLASCKKYKGIFEIIEVAQNDIRYHYILALSDWDSALFPLSDLPGNLEVLVQPRDIMGLYRKASIVLNLSLPHSWVETFGMTIIEGMSFGCPVIAPNYGGPREIIVPNYNGFLLDQINCDEVLTYINMVEENYIELSINASKTAAKYSFANFKAGVSSILNH